MWSGWGVGVGVWMWTGWGVGVGVDWLGHARGGVGVVWLGVGCGGCTSESREEVWKSGELIVSRYIAESITTDAGRFGHIGLCQLRTKLISTT